MTNHTLRVTKRLGGKGRREKTAVAIWQSDQDGPSDGDIDKPGLPGETGKATYQREIYHRDSEDLPRI